MPGPEARAALADADVALSLDNALIPEATFAVPRHGVVNVHHGAVPDYRGGPPVFWELADGRETVGFTVHRIDAGIDTGPVLAAGDVPIVREPTLAATLAADDPGAPRREPRRAGGRPPATATSTGAPQPSGGRTRPHDADAARLPRVRAPALPRPTHDPP